MSLDLMSISSKFVLIYSSRNVGDLITPIAVPPSTPTPAAILPGPISTGVLTSRQPTMVKPEPQEQLDIKPSLLGLPEGIQVTPTSVPSAIATPTTSAVTAIQPQTAGLVTNSILFVGFTQSRIDVKNYGFFLQICTLWVQMKHTSVKNLHCSQSALKCIQISIF